MQKNIQKQYPFFFREYQITKNSIKIGEDIFDSSIRLGKWKVNKPPEDLNYICCYIDLMWQNLSR